MKKSLLFMAFLFIMGGLCANADVLKVEFNTTDLNNTSTSYVTTAFDFTKNDVTFNTNQINPTSGQVKVNQGNATTASGNFYVYNTTAIQNIYKIEIEMVSGSAIASSKANLVSIRTSDSPITTSELGTITGSIDGTTLTLIPENVDKSFFRIDVAKIGGTVKFSSMSIYYGEAKGTANLAWKTDDEVLSDDAEITAALGVDFNAPTLVNDYNLPIVYESSNEGVATIDENGNIELVGEGKTVIKASSEETEKYMAGTVSYTLMVTDPSLVYETFVIDVKETKLNSTATSFTNLEYVQGNNKFQFNVINPSTGAARGNQSTVGDNFSFYNITELPNVSEIVLVFESGSIKQADKTHIQVGDNALTTASADGAIGVYDANAKELSLVPDSKDKSYFRVQFENNSTSGTTTIKEIRIVTSYKKVECPYDAEALTPAHAEGTVALDENGVAVIEIENGDLDGVAIHYMHTPAEAPEAVVRRAIAEGYSEAALVDGVHSITVNAPGSVSYYGYHAASGAKGVERTVTVTPYENTTGIENVGVDAGEGEVEWFNLQGVKVEVPVAGGLYIRRQGGEVSKVIVK